MRAWEFLTESFDQPYPVKLTKAEVDGEPVYHTSVSLPDNTQLDIEFDTFDEEDGNPVWTMEFGRGGSNEITGEGDAMRIFATVVEAIRQFISQEKPYKLGFSARKPFRFPRSRARNKSRSKLYARMVKRFAGQMGYQVDIQDSTIDTDFMLTNPNYKKTDADITESFNQPYPIKVAYDTGMQRYEGAAQLPDGSNLRVMIEEYMGVWDVEFDRDYSTELTGGGDAFKIFATVIEAIRQFIKLEKPYEVTFSASKEAGDVQVGNAESRAKLYNRLVDRFATKMGYNALINDYGSTVEYELVNRKRKPVRESYTKPQLDVEWDEAKRYPEFRKIGKEAWIELASKGKAVTVTDASDINNTDAADPDSFKTLDPAKQKRAMAQVKRGKVELPVVAVYSDGHKELIGGNTRLTAMMAKHGKGIVWQFRVPDEIIDENFKDGKVKGKSRPGRVKRAGASCKGSVSSLRAKAKKHGGEKGKMYHWCANMKGGKKKSK